MKKNTVKKLDTTFFCRQVGILCKFSKVSYFNHKFNSYMLYVGLHFQVEMS